jgi:hypothetical protein
MNSLTVHTMLRWRTCCAGVLRAGELWEWRQKSLRYRSGMHAWLLLPFVGGRFLGAGSTRKSLLTLPHHLPLISLYLGLSSRDLAQFRCVVLLEF